MKIPVERIELHKELPGYDDKYWVEVPKSITEGWLYDFQKQRQEEDRKAAEAAAAANGAVVVKDEAETTRASMLTLLELVVSWSLDDDAGKQLPLIRTIKAASEKAAVIRQIPLDVLMLITKKVTAGAEIDQLTADLPKGS